MPKINRINNLDLDASKLISLPNEMILKIAENLSPEDLTKFKQAIPKNATHVNLDILYLKFLEKLKKIDDSIVIHKQQSYYSQYKFHFDRIKKEQEHELFVLDRVDPFFLLIIFLGQLIVNLMHIITFNIFKKSFTLEKMIENDKKIDSLNLNIIRWQLKYSYKRYLNQIINRGFNHELSLNLRGLSLTRIPENFIELAPIEYWQQLSRLDLGRNSIKKFTYNITKLNHLRFIDLSSNRLKQLPSFLSQITSLEEIKCTFNQIKTISPEIVNLPNLRSLSLEYNHIEALPNELSTLHHLENLSLRRNQIQTIPNQTLPKGLLRLNLNSNQLTHLPNDISQLTDLQSLDISFNQFSEIPDCIINLPNLRKVRLDFNKIWKDIPSDLQARFNFSYLTQQYKWWHDLTNMFSSTQAVSPTSNPPKTILPDTDNVSKYLDEKDNSFTPMKSHINNKLNQKEVLETVEMKEQHSEEVGKKETPEANQTDPASDKGFQKSREAFQQTYDNAIKNNNQQQINDAQRKTGSNQTFKK